MNAGYKAISAEFSYGRHDLVQAVPADPENETYWFLSATVEEAGLYATFGAFGKDLGGEYYEAGYSVSVGELDLSAAWIYSTDDHTIVFSISHTFGIDIE